MKHVNIPIFIPHLGCPNQCVFCNQRSISGVSEFDINCVKQTIDKTLATIPNNKQVEIAFFGGSFTGIDRDLMISLLEIAYEYIKSGQVSHIRCSTRPDYINSEILDILKKYGVNVIELGLQSSSDDVLLSSRRGHTFKTEEDACKLIIDYGFDLVGQMMIGLPNSSLEDEENTARFIISTGAKYARIYPTVVFKNTELCCLTEQGGYTPLTLDEAVARSARILKMFNDAGINTIRVGLCASDNLISDDTYYAGPNHPAIGELVENEIYLNEIKKQISDINFSSGDVLKISVAKNCLSKAIGQKRKNKLLLTQTLKIGDVIFKEEDSLANFEVSVVVERNK